MGLFWGSTEDWIVKGNEHLQNGDYGEAVNCFSRAADKSPDSAIPWYCLAFSFLHGNGDLNAATEYIDYALHLDPYDTDALNLKALILVNQGDYGGALAYYDGALRVDADNRDAWFGKGLVLSHLEMYDEALKSFDAALSIDPNTEGAWVWKGKALLCLERQEKALECLNNALLLNRDDWEAWECKGEILMVLEDYAGAVEAFDQAVALNDGAENSWLQRGRAQIETGDMTGAAASLDRAFSLDPGNAEVWWLRGIMHVELSHYDEALACYDRALVIDPEHPEYLYRKGVALQLAGRAYESLEYFDKALRIEPDNPEFITKKGIALEDLNRYEEALACFEAALADNPDLIEAILFKGVALAGLNRYEEALQCMGEVRGKIGDVPEAHAAFLAVEGLCYAEMNNPVEAQSRFSHALIKCPGNPEILGLKGFGLAMLNLPGEAIPACDEALAADPESELALAGKALSLVYQGHAIDGFALFEKALSKKTDSYLLWGKALALLMLGRQQEALPLCDRAVAADPHDSHAWSTKGLCYLSLKRPDLARDCCRKALEINPYNRDAKKFLARVDGATAEAAPPARTGAGKEVFISHSSKDKEVADLLCSKLEAAGLGCWIAPRDILPGQDYHEEIIDAIETCPAMVVICSSSSITSRHVNGEVKRAFDRDTLIIPLMVEETELSKAMQYCISDAQWIGAFNGIDARIVETIKRAVIAGRR
ncbi:tetratricopeptide repeat protein [Methanoculleus sp. 7T]|uniref:tetratricopeptide repeat protein n=1 Tax=Methanoculleus sp. 7T TaxID=2937282 RepID=UPI0024A6FE5B|nr:tetratricopeptide repeat protein [Methanoculleus sp. 7T]